MSKENEPDAWETEAGKRAIAILDEAGFRVPWPGLVTGPDCGEVVLTGQSFDAADTRHAILRDAARVFLLKRDSWFEPTLDAKGCDGQYAVYRQYPDDVRPQCIVDPGDYDHVGVAAILKVEKEARET